MEVRITYRCEVYIKGESLVEIKEKFDEMPLFPESNKDCPQEFVELNSVERVDDDSYTDLTSDFSY